MFYALDIYYTIVYIIYLVILLVTYVVIYTENNNIDSTEQNTLQLRAHATNLQPTFNFLNLSIL